jgi:hypothetical protein
LIAAIVALTVVAPAAPVALAAGPVHTCQSMAFSPDFVHDGTGFCVTLGYQPGSYAPDGTAVAYRTTDRGRSWQRRASRGLDPLLGAGIKQVLVSAAFASDHQVYVHVAGRGLLVSSDGGDSWLPIDPIGDSATDHANYAVLAAGAAMPLAFADEVPALVSPPLHVPVAGTPGTELQFFGAEFGAVFAASLDAEDVNAARSRLYRCDAALACPTALFTFPAGHEWQNGWVDPAYATNNTLYAVTTAGTRLHVWRSTDGGRGFAAWRGLEAAIGTGTQAYRPTLSLSVRPRSSTMFARLSFRIQGAGPAPPGEQLLRSDDGGRSWRRVAYQLAYGQRGRRGTLPWDHPGHAFGLPGTLQLLPDGRLMTVAEKFAEYEGVFCSADGGRSWKRTCP